MKRLSELVNTFEKVRDEAKILANPFNTLESANTRVLAICIRDLAESLADLATHVAEIQCKTG
jgi:hypothetical protein